MNTLTGTTTRTITGYLVTLLEYPRWMIAREVDFTNCHLGGAYEAEDDLCMDCAFGDACRWLCRDEPSLDTPLNELLDALQTSLPFVRERLDPRLPHDAPCDCDTCAWLREAHGFLRTHRHRR
jgi:hypothetical protein